MYFDLFGLNFKVWDGIIKRFERYKSVRDRFQENGKLLLRQWLNLCDNIINEDALPVEFEGKKTFAVNSSSVFADDIGNKIVKKLSPMAIIWHQNKNGDITVSLRSGGSVDVSKLASKYGGGGHKRSAAFRVQHGEKLPWKKI